MSEMMLGSPQKIMKWVAALGAEQGFRHLKI